jgi:hypothetical protein
MLSIKDPAFHPGKDAPACASHPENVERGGLEDFSRTKEDEMTAATFDHQVGNRANSSSSGAMRKRRAPASSAHFTLKRALNLGCVWKRIPRPPKPSRDQNPRRLIENCGKVHWLPTQAMALYNLR